MKFLSISAGILLIAVAVLELVKGLSAWHGGDRVGVWFGVLVLVAAGAGLIILGVRKRWKH